MRVGNFSLRIPEGVERHSGHISVPHGAQYRLSLSNHCYDRRCDVQLSIDGKDIGCYRIERGGQITLERSFADQGRFTFFKTDSAEGQQAGAADVSREEQGVVRAVFRAERKPVQTLRPTSTSWSKGLSYRGGPGGQGMYCSFAPDQVKTSGMQAGITGLTGSSDQRFTDVAGLDYDPALETTICVRLVCDAGVPSVRRLEPVARVPAPVD